MVHLLNIFQKFIGIVLCGVDWSDFFYVGVFHGAEFNSRDIDNIFD